MELHRTGVERTIEHAEQKPLREQFDAVIENIDSMLEEKSGS
jgi:hypothetical protein